MDGAESKSVEGSGCEGSAILYDGILGGGGRADSGAGEGCAAGDGGGESSGSCLLEEASAGVGGAAGSRVFACHCKALSRAKNLGRV